MLRPIAILCLVLGILPARSGHAEDEDPIVGTWTIITLLPTDEVESTLTIARDDDGALVITHKDQRGRSTKVDRPSFEGGVLRFVRSMGPRRVSFEAEVEGDRLKGHHAMGRRRIEAIGARGKQADALRAERKSLEVRGGDPEKHYDRAARRAMPRDGFPVLFDPILVPAAKATSIRDDEPVLGVAIGGEAKAYPISIMGRHELANDTCGGRPIAASW